MKILLYFLGLIVAVLIAALGELVSDEIRARLDRLPMAVLRAAARRLPRELRAEVYGQAWLPELHHILRGEEALPVTRIIHGMRFALRLWFSAPEVARELSTDGSQSLTGRIMHALAAPDWTLSVVLGSMQWLLFSVIYAVRGFPWLIIIVLGGNVGSYCATEAIVRRFPGLHKLFRRMEPFIRPRQGKSATVCRALIVPAGIAGIVLVTLIACKYTFSWKTLPPSIFAITYVQMLLPARGFKVSKSRSRSHV